jgi:hypothetical protein
MNEEKMKSAIELALERTERFGQQAREDQVALTEEMTKEIEEIEKEYEAKIAEKDVMLQSELKKLYQSLHPMEAEQKAAILQAQFNEEKKTLREEKTSKVEEIKKSAAGG